MSPCVCPAKLAGGLDNRIRRWFQDPKRITAPYIRAGMTVLDLGCGPGFFTIEMAYMVGETGKVIAADLQDGMLRKLEKKISGTEIGGRITLHKCRANSIGLSEKIDFVLLFYMVHEIPDKDAFFKELAAILVPGGRILMVEPPIHVSARSFEESLRHAREAGLAVAERPRMGLDKTAVLIKP
jgi:ubiquinone/menaquinone biosynthesis C-methylase UbiE